MFPQYQMIRDFDLYQNDYYETSRFSAPIFHKQDFLKQTQDNEQETDNFISATRSLKSKSLSIQTSFQHSIMEQHALAFKKILQKYMENSYPAFKKVYAKSLAYQIFEIDEEQSSGEQKPKTLILKDARLFQQKEKKQFLTDLFYQQKLHEFLTIVCNNTNSQLALELIFISNLFWQAYIPKQQIGLSQAQIKSLVDQLLESASLQKYLEKIQFLNFFRAVTPCEIDQTELKQNLKNFLKQFGNTILLVIEEYFQNPYSKEDQGFDSMKRSLNFKDISNDQFSDDENEVNFSVAHKKRKI